MNKRLANQLKATNGSDEAIQRLADLTGAALAEDNSDDDGRGGVSFGVRVYKPGSADPAELLVAATWDEEVEGHDFGEDVAPRCLAFLKQHGAQAVYAHFAGEAYTPEEWAVEADAYLGDARDARVADRGAARRPFRAVDRTGQTWEAEELDGRTRRAVTTVFVVTGPPERSSPGSDYASHPALVVSSDARWHKVGQAAKMTEPGHAAWEGDKRMTRLG